MKRICLLLSLFIANTSFGQTYPAWSWAMGSGGGVNGYAIGISASPTGNIFTLGRVGTATSVTIGSNGTISSIPAGNTNTAYEGRFDRTGTFTWAAPHSYSTLDIPWGFARDKADNIYSAGATSTGNNMWIDKYNNAGTLVFSVNNITTAGTNQGQIYGIAVDTANNEIYITGTYAGNLSFPTSPVTVLTYTGTTPAPDVFIAKFTAAGTLRWVVSAGSVAGNDQSRAIVVRNGFVYVCGSYTSTVAPVFKSTTAATLTGVVSATAALYVVKYDTAGVVQSLVNVPNAGPNANNTEKLDMVIDDANNLYLTGAYRGSATFGATTLTSPSGTDNNIFIAKLLPANTWSWAKSAGGTGDDRGQGIALDKNMNPYITGSFATTSITFDALPALINAGSTDVFVAKYDKTSGAAQWSQRGGGPGNEEGIGISVDTIRAGAVYIAGSYGASGTGAVFGSTTLNTTVNFNPFYARLNTDNLSLSPNAAYCVGATVNIPYTVATPFNVGNDFKVQLSNASGSFATPTDISAPLSATGSGTISVTIPPATPAGTGYFMRIVATNPVDTSRDLGVKVKINVLPSVSVLPINPAICAGSSGVALAAQGAATYAWSPATGLSSTTGGNVTANPANTTIYTVTGTDGNGCVNTFRDTVTVNPVPVINVTPASATICGGKSVGLSASGGNTYTWAPPTGLNTTTGPDVIATPATTTTYTVIGISAQNCQTLKTVVVTVNPAPVTAVTLSGPTTFCHGIGTVIMSVPAVGTHTYQWLKNGIPIPGANAANYTADTTGAYRVIVTSNNGCFDTSATTNVVANLLPGAVINTSKPTTFCVGDSVTLFANTGTGFTYTWFKNGAQLGATTSSIVAKDSGAYSVTVGSPQGCNSSSAAVLVLPKAYPIATIRPTTANILLCHNGSVILKTNNSPGLTYQWYIDNQPITNATDSNYEAKITGSYKVTVTNSTGCATTSAVKLVTAYPEPVITADGPISFCWGSSVTLYLTKVSGPGISYTLRKNGQPIGVTTDSTYTITAPGIYDVVVNVGNACTMTTTTTEVTVFTLPIPPIKKLGSWLSTSPVYVSYQWHKNGLPIAGATDTGYRVSDPGTYTLSVIDTNGCTGVSDPVRITVGINSVHELSELISLYPNPATSVVNISTPVAVNAAVYSMDGKMMLQQEATKSIDMSELATGVYLVKLTNSEGQLLKIEKVVKN